MEAEGELLTIAELAIGLAGFSGVVVAFTRQEGLREAERFYFITLLSTAFAAVLLAFVPFGFHHAGLAGPTLWRGSSVVMLIVWVLMNRALLARAARIEGFLGSNNLGSAATAAVVSLPLLIFPCTIANLVGRPMESGALLYLIGLILWLCIAGFTFAYLVLVGARE